jgi:hypothetical protein
MFVRRKRKIQIRRKKLQAFSSSCFFSFFLFLVCNKRISKKNVFFWFAKEEKEATIDI